jgi:hypothetical protein
MTDKSDEERRLAVGAAIARLAPEVSRFRPVSQFLYPYALEVANLYSDLSVHDRQCVSTNLKSGTRKKLLSACGWLAEEAMNHREGKWIQIAFALNVIEGFKLDDREDIRYMVLMRHAARHIGVGLLEVVEFAMTLASGESKRHLQNFVNRDESQNKLESFEVGVERVDGRWRFVPKGR